MQEEEGAEEPVGQTMASGDLRPPSPLRQRLSNTPQSRHELEDTQAQSHHLDSATSQASGTLLTRTPKHSATKLKLQTARSWKHGPSDTGTDITRNRQEEKTDVVPWLILERGTICPGRKRSERNEFYSADN